MKLQEMVEQAKQKTNNADYLSENISFAIMNYASSCGEPTREDIDYLFSIGEDPYDYFDHYEVQTFGIVYRDGKILERDITTVDSFLLWEDAYEFYNQCRRQYTATGCRIVSADNEGYPIETLEAYDGHVDLALCVNCKTWASFTDAGGRTETEMGWLRNECIEKLREEGQELHFLDEEI